MHNFKGKCRDLYFYAVLLIRTFSDSLLGIPMCLPFLSGHIACTSFRSRHMMRRVSAVLRQATGQWQQVAPLTPYSQFAFIMLPREDTARLRSAAVLDYRFRGSESSSIEVPGVLLSCCEWHLDIIRASTRPSSEDASREGCDANLPRDRTPEA